MAKRLDASCGLTGLMQFATKLYQAYSLHQITSICEHQICCNLIFTDSLQDDETTCIKPACSLQLPASLLTTCNRFVIIKPEQAIMRTHPDIGLAIGAFLAV